MLDSWGDFDARGLSETVSFKLRSLGLTVSARRWGLAAKKNATLTFLDEAHAAVAVTEWDRGASGRGWGVERLGGWVEPYIRGTGRLWECRHR